MAKRESKSPLRSLFTIFSKKDEGKYTPVCLGDEKKKFFYDPKTKTY